MDTIKNELHGVVQSIRRPLGKARLKVAMLDTSYGPNPESISDVTCADNTRTLHGTKLFHIDFTSNGTREPSSDERGHGTCGRGLLPKWDRVFKN